MKRASRLLVLAVGSLLLTACQVPDSLEDFIGWREKFFLDVSPEQIQQYLGPVIQLLAMLAFVACLWGLIKDMRRGSLFGAEFVTSFMLLVSLLMVYLFIPTTTRIGRLALPDDLTIDAVLAAMHWELSKDLAKIVTAVWGVTLTLILPIISSWWQIVMLIMAVLSLAWSILGRSLKGIAFIIGEVFGWTAFLVLFNTIVKFFGANYPDWEFAPVTVLVNVFYTGIILLTMAFCYLLVPIIAAILAPDLKDEEKKPSQSGAQSSDQPRRKRDWSGVFAIPIPDIQRPSPHNGNGNGRTRVPDNQEPSYSEGYYRNVDLPELPGGYPSLPSGMSETAGPSSGGGNTGSRPKGKVPGGGFSLPPAPDGKGGGSGKDPDVVDGKYRVLPPVPDAHLRQLQVACDNCGGGNPVSNLNCQFCGNELGAEKTDAIRNQRYYEAETSKRNVGIAARAVSAATTLLAPDMAAVVVPVANAVAGVTNGLIDRKAAKEVGEKPDFGAEQAAGEALKAAGSISGNPTLRQAGDKASKRKRQNTPPVP